MKQTAAFRRHVRSGIRGLRGVRFTILAGTISGTILGTFGCSQLVLELEELRDGIFSGAAEHERRYR
jgi:hypothetical protein